MKRAKSDDRAVRDFARAQAESDRLDGIVNELQQMRRSRFSIVRWWGSIRSRRIIPIAINARDKAMAERRICRRRGLLFHRR